MLVGGSELAVLAHRERRAGQAPRAWQLLDRTLGPDGRVAAARGDAQRLAPARPLRVCQHYASQSLDGGPQGIWVQSPGEPGQLLDRAGDGRGSARQGPSRGIGQRRQIGVRRRRTREQHGEELRMGAFPLARAF